MCLRFLKFGTRKLFSMEVTKSNFETVLQEVKNSIDSCDFLAIDTELTGLYSSPPSEHPFNTYHERYSIRRQLCSNFLVWQFGVSTFKYIPEKEIYTHKDFNFNIFPSRSNKDLPFDNFLCQVSSLQFLSANDFDFNKVIYEGISYLSHQDEKHLRQKLIDQCNVEKQLILVSDKQRTPIDIPPEHQGFVDDVLATVEAFMQNETEQSMNIPPCSSFHRRLLYGALRPRYDDSVELSTCFDENKEKYIKVTKADKEEKLKNLTAKEKGLMDDLERDVGFRKVIDYISQSKKLVIAHNCYLDYFHILNKFFYSLPKDLKEYQDMLHTVLPNVMDTKYLAHTDTLKPLFGSLSLSKLLEKLRKETPGDLPIDETNNVMHKLDGGAYHNAGFDAFVAGACFIGLSGHLGGGSSFKAMQFDASSTILKPHINKLFNMPSMFDSPYFDICESYPEFEERDYVFHVTFQSDCREEDLQDLFAPFGSVFVHWLDNTSAYVALTKKENAALVKSSLMHNESQKFRIRPYGEMTCETGSQKTCISDNNKRNESSKRRKLDHHKKERTFHEPEW